MKITVAALMTTDWIAQVPRGPRGVTRIMIPGMCEGDDRRPRASASGVPAEKGPADLKALPSWFGQADARAGYGERDIRVFAEINHVPRLDRDEILAIAEHYRDAGADVIDLGLSLGRNWLDDGPGVIAELRDARLRAEHRHARPRRDPDGRRGRRATTCSASTAPTAHLAERLSRDAGADPGHARGPRQPRRDDRPPRGARQAVPRRPDHRADRLRASRRASAATSRSAGAIRTPRCSWASATSPSSPRPTRPASPRC